MNLNFFDAFQIQLGKMNKYNYLYHIISHLSYFVILKWSILTKNKKNRHITFLLLLFYFQTNIKYIGHIILYYYVL